MPDPLAGLLVLALATPAAAQDLEQLSPGPYATAWLDWDFGRITIEHPVSGLPYNVDHYGRIYFPVDGNGNVAPTVDGFPLVAFGHGRFYTPANWPTNHLQAEYLLERLASHGIVATSVNLGVVGSFQAPSAIPQRGELLCGTLRATAASPPMLGAIPNPLRAAIDPSRMGLLGHSRGGEGTLACAMQNLAHPDPLSILAVANIAPTNSHSFPLEPGLPYMTIYGSKDGDVAQGQPLQLFDLVDSDERVFEQIFGANHFWFTESINYVGEGPGDITRAEHHEIAMGYLAGFMARKLAVTPEPSDVFADGPEMAPVTSITTILPQYQAPQRFVVDDFEWNFAVELTSEGLPAGVQGGQYHAEKSLLGNTYYHRTRGLELGWSNETAGWWAETPPGYDASGWPFLSVKLVQRSTAPLNTPGLDQDVAMLVIDGDGDFGRVLASAYGEIPYPPQHFAPAVNKSVLRTIRFPLGAFVADNPALDLDDIARVAVVTGVTPQGEIAIDRVEFTE